MAVGTSFETLATAELATRGVLQENEAPRPIALVVDDERVIADTLAAILGSCGFVAFAAYDGASALDLAAVIPPELLVTDVVMPGISGVELAVAIKEAIPDCRVLLFSGQAMTTDILADIRGRGYDFPLLAKPVHPRDLLEQISLLGVRSAPVRLQP